MKLSIIAISIALIITASTLSQSMEAPSTNDGQELFDKNCVKCHSFENEGKINLTNKKIPKTNKDLKRLIETKMFVYDGRTDSNKTISDLDAEILLTHLKKNYSIYSKRGLVKNGKHVGEQQIERGYPQNLATRR